MKRSSVEPNEELSTEELSNLSYIACAEVMAAMVAATASALMYDIFMVVLFKLSYFDFFYYISSEIQLLK